MDNKVKEIVCRRSESFDGRRFHLNYNSRQTNEKAVRRALQNFKKHGIKEEDLTNWCIFIDTSKKANGRMGVLLTDARLIISSYGSRIQSTDVSNIQYVYLVKSKEPLIYLNNDIAIDFPDCEPRAVEAFYDILVDIRGAFSLYKDSKRSYPKVEESSIYERLTDFTMHSEQIRWTRLNNLLLVNSILILAWSSLLLAPGRISLLRGLALILLCILGIFCSVLWSHLGIRSSDYLDTYYKVAASMERSFNPSQARPFLFIESIREKVSKGPRKLTSSRWIVKWIPLLFAMILIVMLAISLIYLFACGLGDLSWKLSTWT